MNVDVNFGRGHFKKQQHHGVDGGRQHVAIGLGESVLHQAVADEASVDEDEDGVAVEFLDFGLGDEAVHAKFAERQVGGGFGVGGGIGGGDFIGGGRVGAAPRR